MRAKRILLTITTLFLAATSAAAMNLGTNITVYDGISIAAVWHDAQEDQEVEPGDTPGQQWDLEGFFVNGTQLTIVGGFDFAEGELGYESGDIFIDINGDAQYGPTNTAPGGDKNAIVTDTFGYDYVFDLSFDSGNNNYSYDVYKLIPNASTVSVYYDQNDESNPWRYNSGGELLYGDVSFTYFTGLSDGQVDGLLGGTHNALAVDIGFLAGIIPGNEFISHFTIECGNDNLMGKGVAPVPEPTTILLSGIGLLGIGVFLRKKLGLEQ